MTAIRRTLLRASTFTWRCAIPAAEWTTPPGAGSSIRSSQPSSWDAGSGLRRSAELSGDTRARSRSRAPLAKARVLPSCSRRRRMRLRLRRLRPVERICPAAEPFRWGRKGALTVASAPGKGSCFTILFPAAANAIAVAPVTARRTDLSGSGTILVVDDERIVREMARKSLERQGYRVLLADHGLEAIDVFKRHPGDIALVFLDLSMPGMGGAEVQI